MRKRDTHNRRHSPGSESSRREAVYDGLCSPASLDSLRAVGSTRPSVRWSLPRMYCRRRLRMMRRRSPAGADEAGRRRPAASRDGTWRIAGTNGKRPESASPHRRRSCLPPLHWAAGLRGEDPLLLPPSRSSKRKGKRGREGRQSVIAEESEETKEAAAGRQCRAGKRTKVTKKDPPLIAAPFSLSALLGFV